MRVAVLGSGAKGAIFGSFGPGRSGRQALGIATPFNELVVLIAKALEATVGRGNKSAPE